MTKQERLMMAAWYYTLNALGWDAEWNDSMIFWGAADQCERRAGAGFCEHFAFFVDKGYEI